MTPLVTPKREVVPKSKHEDTVARTAAHVAQPQSAQVTASERAQPGSAADRELGLLERDEGRRAEDIDRQHQFGAAAAAAEANAEPAVVEQAGVGDPGAAQLALELAAPRAGSRIQSVTTAAPGSQRAPCRSPQNLRWLLSGEEE